MDRVHHGLHVVHRGFRKDAVAEVEDVARAALGPPQDVPDPLADLRGRRQQGHGVQVALDGHVVAHAAPCPVQVHAPVHPDHVAARLPHELQEAAGAGAEVDDRDAGSHPRHQPAHVRQHVFPVVLGGKATHPTVEHLERLDAGFDLGVDVGHGGGHEPVHERAPSAVVVVEEPLGVDVVARGAAFDQVRRQREGGAAEPDQGRPPPQGRARGADRIIHVGEGLFRRRVAQPVDVPGRPQGPLDHRPGVAVFEPHAHGLQQEQDVGEQDGGVHLEALHRSDRHLRHQVRGLAQFQEADPGPQVAVMVHVAPRLPHEPDRGVGGPAAAAGGKEGLERLAVQSSRSFPAPSVTVPWPYLRPSRSMPW